MISAAVAPSAQPERPEVGDDVGHGDHGVEHRDVDVLARAGGVAVAEGRQHADHRVEPGPDVAERADRRDDRRLVAAALELVDARHRLDDRRERRPRVVGRRHGVPEAGHRQVDRARVHGGDVGVAEPEAWPWRRPSSSRRSRRSAGASRSTRSRPAGRLEVDRRCTACRGCCAGRWRRRCGPRGRSSPAASRARGRRPSGSRPSPRRRRGGRAAGWRRGAPASARGRGCGRRRAACPRPPRRRWRRLRGAWADGRREM